MVVGGGGGLCYLHFNYLEYYTLSKLRRVLEHRSTLSGYANGCVSNYLFVRSHIQSPRSKIPIYSPLRAEIVEGTHITSV